MEKGKGVSAPKGKGGPDHGGMEHINTGALHTLVNSLPAYLYSVHYHDGLARDTRHSPQCQKVTGYSPWDYKRDPELWLKMIYPPDRETVRKFFDDLSNMRPSERGSGSYQCNLRGTGNPICACNDDGYMLEHRIIHKEGMVRWIANRCVAVHDEKHNLIRFYGLVMDITDQKISEDEMAARLEKERQHAVEMETLTKRAEEVVAQNNRFISLIVHDLRSPIASVITYMNLLKIQYNEGDVGNVSEVFRRIGGINENLLALIDDLLSVSRFQSGAIQLKKKFFDAFALAQQVLDGFQLQADMKGVELKCLVKPGIRIYADFGFTHEVLGNIVSNAVKYCGKGNTITVSARRGPLPIIAVANDGLPINPKLLPDIFSFDVPTSTPGTSGERGTGLGLPLSAEIMQLQGGELRVANGAERGCVFEAVFPEIQPVVLVVDDNKIDRLLISRQVAPLNLDVITANNGEEALTILKGRKVHLVIADLIMPDMDGYELLRIIRQNKGNDGIRFIAITGSPGSEICQRVMDMGADDFVNKSANPEELLIRVRRFVG